MLVILSAAGRLLSGEVITKFGLSVSLLNGGRVVLLIMEEQRIEVIHEIADLEKGKGQASQ